MIFFNQTNQIFTNYKTVNCGRWPKEVWLRIQNDDSLRRDREAVLFDEEEQPVPMTVGNEEFALRGRVVILEFLSKLFQP